MLCKSPFLKGNMAFGCGQCLHCRINARRLWAHRLMLEVGQHAESSFVTLTYADEHLPANGSLDPESLTLFLKRLRKSIGKFRYYAVGEYGDRTERPHYHLFLFGVPLALAVQVQECWRFGHIHAGTCTEHSASYIAGYVTKKLTNKLDPELRGRYPEFARMSLKPGIGATAMKDVGEQLTRTRWGAKAINDIGDVPLTLQYGPKSTLPLGRYLRTKLREEVGLPNETPERAITAYKESMQALQESYGTLAFKAAKPFLDHEKMTRNERRKPLTHRKL